MVKQEYQFNPFGSDFESDQEDECLNDIHHEADVVEISEPEQIRAEPPKVFIPEISPLGPHVSMRRLDQQGYRAIWTSYRPKDSYKVDAVAEIRIRMLEEYPVSGNCQPGSTYYEKCINSIDTMKLSFPYQPEEHIKLNRMIMKLFFESIYHQNKIEEYGIEIYNKVRSKIGEQ